MTNYFIKWQITFR